MSIPEAQFDPRWATEAAVATQIAHPRAATSVTAESLVSDLAREIAGPLTAALDRLDALRATGQIDVASLAELRAQVARAREAAMIGQRLGRLTRGKVRQSSERLDLTRLLRSAVDECGEAIAQRGLEVREILRPAEVVVDAVLAFSLVKALVDWSVEHAQARVDLAVDVKTWPVRARLSCRFAHVQCDMADAPWAADARRLDSMSWHLVQQTALALGLQVQRDVSGGQARVVIEFPRTVSEPIRGVSVVEIDDTNAGFVLDAATLAGSHVLVVAPRRETRTMVRDAVRSMGLLLDFVESVDAARRFCAAGLPHAIVYEAAIAGERFEQWRQELQTQAPALGFIEVGEQGREYESLLRDGRQYTRVGRDGLPSTLPAALGFELSKALAG
jgi:hypothetical protein